MPGLLRGMARTAVVAGTATAVSGNVQRRQARRHAESDAETYAAQQPAAPADGMTNNAQFAELKQLGDLRDQGILTQSEFEAKKAQILGL